MFVARAAEVAASGGCLAGVGAGSYCSGTSGSTQSQGALPRSPSNPNAVSMWVDMVVCRTSLGSGAVVWPALPRWSPIPDSRGAAAPRLNIYGSTIQ